MEQGHVASKIENQIGIIEFGHPSYNEDIIYKSEIKKYGYGLFL